RETPGPRPAPHRRRTGAGGEGTAGLTVCANFAVARTIHQPARSEVVMRSAICVLLLLASPALADNSVYSWRTRDDDPDRVYLYQDGRQSGGWSCSGKYSRPSDGETWGAKSNRSPVPPPERTSVNVTMPRQSPTLLPLRGLKVRMGTFMGQIMLAEFEQMTPLISQAIADAAKESMNSLLDSLHLGR